MSYDPRDLWVRENIYKDAIWFYGNKLGEKTSSLAATYLKSRGFDLSDIYKNKLGYSDGSGLLNFLINVRGYRISDGIKYGLIDHSLNESFKDRIILPCIDQDNETILGITSRLIEEKEGLPKYKNLSGCKWKLYSPHNIKSTNKELFIVEGPFDVLTLSKAGYQAICFMGTNGFNAKYTSYLKDYQFNHRPIYCLPDNDPLESQAFKCNMNQYIKLAISLGANSLSNLPANIHIASLSAISSFSSLKDVNDLLIYLKNPKYPKDSIRVFKKRILNLLVKSIMLDKTIRWQEYWNEKEKLKNYKHLPHKNNEEYDIRRVISLLKIDIIREDDVNERIYCRCFNPDHEDSTPSCCVYLETKSSYCYGCGESSQGAIGMVMLALNKDFKEAINWLKQNY